MESAHKYIVSLAWTGNKGEGTSSYRAYERSHTISVAHKPDLQGSSDPAFRGDRGKYNPEELLVAALSACHMLTYLHLCATHGVIVTAYEDNAIGLMQETSDGGGHFSVVTLSPVVTIQDRSMAEKASALHKQAHQLCFIANSMNFPVRHQPTCKVG